MKKGVKKKPVIHADDVEHMLLLIEQSLKKQYQKTRDVQDWLNANAIQTEVWKN